MLGWEPSELIGQAGDAVYPSRESYEAMVAIAIPVLGAGRQLDVEWELRRNDGSGFWCRRTGRALEPGNISKGYVWLYEDITERKRADAEVQRMVREQELILANAAVGIAFVRNRAIQRCNPFLEKTVGAAPGALIGKSSSVLFANAKE